MNPRPLAVRLAPRGAGLAVQQGEQRLQLALDRLEPSPSLLAQRRDGSSRLAPGTVLLPAGLLAMVMGLLIAGYEQSQIERAIGGSTWMAYFEAQGHRWFVQAMTWRQIGGWMFAGGFVLLAWDLLTIGKRETRPAVVLQTEGAAA